MNRREMLSTTGLGIAGFAIGTGASAPACPGGKNPSPFVVTVVGALEELKPLLPGQVQLLSKGITIAKDFNDAYSAGKFENATSLFENLAGVISQIITDAGVGVSQSVKVAIAVAGVAMRAIAVLMKQQASDPAVASAVNAKAASSPAASRQKTLIEKLADPVAINELFEAAKP